jgi:hypothetical protein
MHRLRNQFVPDECRQQVLRDTPAGTGAEAHLGCICSNVDTGRTRRVTANFGSRKNTTSETQIMTSPNALLDFVIEHLELKNDAALSRALQVAPPVISKIRHGHLPIGNNMLCRISEATGIMVGALREWAGLSPLLKVAA